MEMAVPPTDTVTQTDVPPPSAHLAGVPGGHGQKGTAIHFTQKELRDTAGQGAGGGGVIPEVHEPYSPTPLCPHRPLELTCS